MGKVSSRRLDTEVCDIYLPGARKRSNEKQWVVKQSSRTARTWSCTTLKAQIIQKTL